MSPQEEKEFIEKAFQKLKERGWLPGQELEPSAITELETAAFEQQYQVTLPSLYKTFFNLIPASTERFLHLFHC